MNISQDSNSNSFVKNIDIEDSDDIDANNEIFMGGNDIFDRLHDRLQEAVLELHLAVDELRAILNRHSSLETKFDSALSESSGNDLQSLVPSSIPNYINRKGVECVQNSTEYERRRAARRLDRSLDNLEKCLHECEASNCKTQLSNENLNDLILILLIITEQQIDFYDCLKSHDARTNSNVDILRDSNLALFKISSEKASRIASKYAALPLEVQNLDSLIDHVAYIFSHPKYDHKLTTLSSSSFSPSSIYSGVERSHQNLNNILEPLLQLLNQTLQYESIEILLSKFETIKLLEMLTQYAMQDLTYRWDPVCTTNNHNYAFHIRIFIHFLLQHLVGEDINKNQRLDINNSKDQMKNNDDVARGLKDKNNGYIIQDNGEVECNTAMVFSQKFQKAMNEYLQELIEYALDSIEGATSYCNNKKNSYNNEHLNPRREAAANSSKIHRKIQANTDTSSKLVPQSLHSYMVLQEGIFHVSLVVNTAQIIEIINPSALSTQDFVNSFQILFTAFTTFMATFSLEIEDWKKNRHYREYIHYHPFFLIPFHRRHSYLFVSLSHFSLGHVTSNEQHPSIIREETHLYNACVISLLATLSDNYRACTNGSVDSKTRNEQNDIKLLLDHSIKINALATSISKPGQCTFQKNCHITRKLTKIAQMAAVSSMSNHDEPPNISNKDFKTFLKYYHEANGNPDDEEKCRKIIQEVKNRRNQQNNAAHFCSFLLNREELSTKSIDQSRFDPWHSLIAKKLRESLDIHDVGGCENILGDDIKSNSSYEDTIMSYCDAVRMHVSFS